MGGLYVGLWGGTARYEGWVQTTFNEHDLGKTFLLGVNDENPHLYCSGHGCYWVYYDVTDKVVSGLNTGIADTSRGERGNKLDGRVYGIDLKTFNVTSYVQADNNLLFLRGKDINDDGIIGVDDEGNPEGEHYLHPVLAVLVIEHKTTEELVYLVCEDIFEAVYLNEAEWFQALDDIKKGQHYMIGSNFKILAFCSKSTVSAKARRFKQADLCIVKGANESINLTTWKSKKWPKPDLTKVAKVIRLAEAKRQGEKVQDSNLDQIGTLLNWFLHESLSFLSHGSFKKTDVLPSSLQLDEIMNLTIFCFDPQEKYLGDFSKDFETFRRVLSDPIKIEKSEFANKNGGKGDAIQGKS